MSLLAEVLIGIFGFIISMLGAILVINFKDMKLDVKKMSSSMGEMNVKLEKVITDQTWHKEEMNEIKSRLTTLENN